MNNTNSKQKKRIALIVGVIDNVHKYNAGSVVARLKYLVKIWSCKTSFPIFLWFFIFHDFDGKNDYGVLHPWNTSKANT